MDIQNPHDRFFKEIFSDLSVTQDFICNYLPEELVRCIDIHTLTIEKDSFVTKNLPKTLSKTAIKLLTKKFGSLPDEMQAQIPNLDYSMLEKISDEILDYQTLDEVKKHLK